MQIKVLRRKSTGKYLHFDAEDGMYVREVDEPIQSTLFNTGAFEEMSEKEILSLTEYADWDDENLDDPPAPEDEFEIVPVKITAEIIE